MSPRLRQGASVLAVVFLLAGASPGRAAAEREASSLVSVWLPSPPSDPKQLRLRARIPGAALEVASVQPLDKRPLLLVVDPNSYGRTEIRKQVAAFGRALAAAGADGRTPVAVRIGFPVLDGVLGPLLTNRATLAAELDRAVTNLLTDGADAEPMTLGRTLDLVVSLTEKAEKEGGATDCVLLFRDRRFEGDDAAYLNRAVARYMEAAATRGGSTFHGPLAGDGLLREVCAATGGVLLAPGEPIEALARRLQAASGRTLLVRLVARGLARGGGYPLELTTEPAVAGVRAPAQVWYSVDGTPVPSHHHVRQALDWLRRVREAESDGNLTRAVRFIDAAVTEDSWNAGAFVLGGRLAKQSGDLPLAGRLLERALAVEPPSQSTLLLAASVLRTLGNPAEALKEIEGYLARGNPVTPELKLERARLLAASERRAAARDLFKELVGSALDGDALRSDLGMELERLGERGAAEAEFRAATAKNPANPTALLGLARAAAGRGSVDEALQMAQRAVASHSDDPDVHVGLGTVQVARGDWKGAADAFRSALALAPARRDARDALVDALSRGGNQAEAAGVLRRWLEGDPRDIGAVRKLAAVQVRGGELSDAVITLEGGAARAGDQAHTLYRAAAELRERRGEYGQALLDYRAMLRTAPPALAGGLKNTVAAHLASLSLLVNGTRTLDGRGLEGDLGPALARLAQAQAKAQAPSDQAGSRRVVVVPGGTDLLARTLGLEPAVFKEPDAIERIFAFVIEANPQQNDRLQDNPIRRDAIACLRAYQELGDHLRRRGLMPRDFDPKRGHDFVFPLVAGPEVLKATQQALGFFGIGLKSKRNPDGGTAVILTLKQNKSTVPRQQLLKHLGVNLNDRSLGEIRFTLRDGELPVLLGTDVWEAKMLARDKGRGKHWLDRMLGQVRAMRLYLALASCSEQTRTGLVASAGPGELLDHADALATFGPYLDFREGKLVFPGSANAWQTFLAAPGAAGGGTLAVLLRRDQGRALVLYATLSTAPRPVQEYLGASSGRLTALYQALGATEPRAKGVPAAWYDLGRALRQVSADERSLLLEIDPRVARQVLPGQTAAPAEPGARVRLDDAQLTRLMDRSAGGSSVMSVSTLDLLELMRFLQSDYPEVLDDAVARAILRDPKQAPGMVDLVLDLKPRPALMLRYLDLARDQAAQGPKGWNANRTRTTQALLHILAILEREGAFTHEQGERLFEEALGGLQTGDEPAFAAGVARFVSERLLPVLAASSKGVPRSELLLRALAGPRGVREFTFEGKRLHLDAAGYKFQRMKATIQPQRFTPLEDLLEAYRLLGASSQSGGARLEALRKALSAVQSIDESAAGQTKAGLRNLPRADLAGLLAKLDASAKTDPNGSASQLLASEVAAGLHPELGVTLLAYCYAYHGAPEADALAFDANFIRKHDFFGASWTREGGWPPARLEQSEATGAYMVGSLSGLGFELSRLETAQSVQNFGRREGRGLVPTLLSGMRVIRRSQRSDRAQEYVALSVRLGREILAQASLDDDVRRWCEGFLDERLPPRRREQVVQFVASGRPQAAAEVLSPSELFFLGEGYRKRAAPQRAEAASEPPRGAPSGGPESAEAAEPESESPSLDRARELIPAGGTAQFREFRREVEQYGILLRRRLGLCQVSLAVSDSYEQLERSVREEVLFERICDLKMRVAELNYALGLPACLGEVQGELAIRDILPASAAVRTNSWKLALEQIARLGVEHARGWVDELLNRGILVLPSDGGRDKGGTQP